MIDYKNLGGNSGVVKYQISATSILVEFKGGAQYLYNYDVPGVAMVEEMKRRAQAGVGLSSYISTTVRKQFSEKIR